MGKQEVQEVMAVLEFIYVAQVQEVPVEMAVQEAMGTKARMEKMAKPTRLSLYLQAVVQPKLTIVMVMTYHPLSLPPSTTAFLQRKAVPIRRLRLLVATVRGAVNTAHS